MMISGATTCATLFPMFQTQASPSRRGSKVGLSTNLSPSAAMPSPARSGKSIDNKMTGARRTKGRRPQGTIRTARADKWGTSTHPPMSLARQHQAVERSLWAFCEHLPTVGPSKDRWSRLLFIEGISQKYRRDFSGISDSAPARRSIAN